MFELCKIDKKFPGVHALKAVDLQLDNKEIVGLVGENGAGKSTLMKIIYGAHQPDSGEIRINDEPVLLRNPRQAMAKGIGMVFQEQSLIPNISLRENIFLGYEHQFIRFGVINWKAMSVAAKRHLEKVHLDIDPATVTSKLSFAQRQMVELAKVLTLEDRVQGQLVILLDEPTSVLTSEEIQLLFSLVRALRSRASFIFVSHRIDEVMELCNRVYVMRDGEVVDVVETGKATVSSIQRKMVGRNVDKQYYREQKQKPYDKNKILVELANLSSHQHYKDISFQLHRGEVLALVGAEGSGCEEIMRTVFGLQSPTSGELRLHGKEVTRFSPFNGVHNKIGYLPRERKREGMIGTMSIYENMTLSQLDAHSNMKVLHIAGEKQLARTWIDRLSIKAASENADCDNLSGGNQQKVVLAKWRSSGSAIMLLDHPTRGLDIGAKEAVYDMVREMCEQAIGILLVSDTLEEAIGLAHTIIIIKDGREQQRYNYKIDKKPSLYDLLRYMI